MKYLSNLAVFTTALVLASCGGNPEEAARTELENAQATWDEALVSLDPQTRLSGYEEAIAAIERVADDYPDTALGQAIASGRPAAGVSLASMTTARDQLAERAACYTDPTAACLRAYANRRAGSGSSTSTSDAIGKARTAICEYGFAEADAALEELKINRAGYASPIRTPRGRDILAACGQLKTASERRRRGIAA